MAGLGKLQGPSWWTGMAIWRTMTAGEFAVGNFTAMAEWPLVLNFLTHFSLALELLYPILIWVRIARPLILAGALAMHLGIAVINPGLAEFSLVMLAANLAFISGPWLRGLATGGDRRRCACSSTGRVRGAGDRWRWSRRRTRAGSSSRLT